MRSCKAQAEALAGWLQSVGVRKGDRVALYMQNCPQFIVAVYGILRADAVVVPVNPMNRADEFSHYITDPQSKAVICSADLAGYRGRGQRSALPEAQRAAAGAGDALHRRHARRPARPGRSARLRRCCRLAARRPRRCPPAPSRWADALAAAPPPPAAHGRARRPGAAALHLGHHRPAQGLHAHPPHADAQRRGGACGATASAETVSLGVVPMFHITGMIYGVLGAGATWAAPWC